VVLRQHHDVMPVALLRRVPFTIAITVGILGLAVVSRSLWDPLQGRSLGRSVAYGLPAFEDGRVWTLATGAVFAIQPLQYFPILLGFLVFGGFAEYCLGAGKAAIAFFVCHVFGVVGTAVLLMLVRDHGYQWATDLAHMVDAGPSAGFLGAAAVASATLRPPWRGRFRVVMATYVLLSAIHLGALTDVEHLLAVSVGLLLGPVLQGRRPQLSLRTLTRRDCRLLASGFFVLAAVESLFQPFSPVTGPLTSTLSESARASDLQNQSLIVAAIEAIVWFWFARSLYKGRRRAWWWAFVVLSLVVLAQLAGMVGLAVQHEPGWPVAIYEVLGNMFGLAVLVLGRRAFRNPSPRRARRTTGALVATVGEDQRTTATALLQEEGTVNNLAWLTTWPENRWFNTPRCSGYVAYRVHAGVALGLCDPVAARPEDRSELLAAFSDKAHHDGLVPCLFSVTQEGATHALTRGWHALEVAEEAVIDLPSLEFRGKAWQDVRTALNQGTKLGITHRLGPLIEQPRGIQVQVRAISSEWVEDKGMPEMGFTLGGVDEALDPEVRVGLAVDADSTVHGVTSWMPIHASGGGEPVGWTLDVMRKLPGGFRYAMEFLISSACLAFKEEGCRLVSLSGAPLAKAGAQDSAMDRDPLDSFLERLGTRLEPYYGFRSLHAFKAKFQPRFEPLFLVFPDEAALPRIGMALSRAYLPDAGLRDIVTLARGGH
jgi:phosphatidylglycerol lysyltransferase